MAKKRDFVDLSDLSGRELSGLISLAGKIKRAPARYSRKLSGKTLLMFFEKPSLRTRVSFEVGMEKMGGHAIYYDVANSPIGKGETIADTAKTASRYVDIILARLYRHEDILEFAKNSTVPVINALTNYSHPCQIVADLMAIKEKKGRLKGLKLCYLGDGNNNVTHSLLVGCAKMGISVSVACPEMVEYSPKKEVLHIASYEGGKTGAKVSVTNDPEEALREADLVVTDSWMSYHIPKDSQEERVKILSPYQVDLGKMSLAKKDAIFLHCLPAKRGMEVTAEVIDGKQSVVFDEAENRLWTEMAIILWLLGKAKL